jgi:hypothetical protein
LLSSSWQLLNNSISANRDGKKIGLILIILFII